MKSGKSIIFILAVVSTGAVLSLGLASCTPESADEKVEVEAEEQSVEQTKAEQTEAEPEEPRFVANQFCAACHADFIDDKLAVTHEKAGIGCERCHGESERHRSDEDNITPPELMYPKERINPTCMMCHPRQDIKHVPYHKKLLEGADTIFDTEPQETTAPQYCTDCHGKNHRMKVRTVRWDKFTGELLEEE